MNISDQPSAKSIVVLLVKEELILRFFIAEFLEDAGFKVIEASTTERAYLALKSNPNINAAIVELDRTGPISDVTLAEMIAMQFPSIALFVTADQVSTDAALPLRAMVMSKPYEPAAATALIRQAVESSQNHQFRVCEDAAVSRPKPSLPQRQPGSVGSDRRRFQ